MGGVFRGFIQTRIRGIIKNKWLSIVGVGVMFATMHIPFQMLKENISIIEYIQQYYKFLIFASILHIYSVYIYTIQDIIILLLQR